MPPEPATDPTGGGEGWRAATLVLIAHGSSRAGAGEIVRRQAREIAGRGLFASVACAFFKAAPDPAAVVDGVTGDAYLVPLMMDEGRLAQDVLPAHLNLDGAVTRRGGRTLFYCRPVGVDPDMGALIERRGLDACRDAGLSGRACTLVIVGHGMKGDPRAGRTLRLRADEIAARGVFAGVAVAFLETAPRLDSALAEVRGPYVVVAGFVGGGVHAEQDVPEAMAARAVADPSAAAGFYAGSVGDDPAIADFAIARVRAFDREKDAAD